MFHDFSSTLSTRPCAICGKPESGGAPIIPALPGHEEESFCKTHEALGFSLARSIELSEIRAIIPQLKAAWKISPLRRSSAKTRTDFSGRALSSRRIPVDSPEANEIVAKYQEKRRAFASGNRISKRSKEISPSEIFSVFSALSSIR